MYKELFCQKCSKKGHIARVCRSGQRQRNPNVSSENQQHSIKQIAPTETDQKQQDPIYNLFNLSKQQSPSPMLLTVTAHGQRLSMEVDTGTSLSLISEKTYLTVWIDNHRPPCSPPILFTDLH